MADEDSAVPSLLKAGQDPAYARKAIDAILRLSGGGSRRQRQQYASDVCGWLRLIWGPGHASHQQAPEIESLSREVAKFLAQGLRNPAADDSLCGLDLDLSRTVIRDATFSGAHFTGGNVDFRGCAFYGTDTFTGSHFSGGCVCFDGATFYSAEMAESQVFAGAVFDGAEVSFRSAEFSNGYTNFDHTQFAAGKVSFDQVKVTDSFVCFTRSRFSGALVSFCGALFRSGRVSFAESSVTGGAVCFERAVIHVPFSFDSTVVDGGTLSFDEASIGGLSLRNAMLKSGKISMKKVVVHGDRNYFDGMNVDGGSLILDEAKLAFGELLLDKVSMVAGTVSLEGIVIELEGSLDLPWGRYAENRVIVTDEKFDGYREHEFYTKTARYAPDVQVRWGEFQPGRGPSSRVQPRSFTELEPGSDGDGERRS